MDKFKHILLVDDDKVSNFITERFLQDSDLVDNLEIVLNGQEALSYFDHCTNAFPDLVLLDINMPLMNGIEFLEFFDKSSFHGNSKIAILTTSNMEEDKSSTMKFSNVIAYVEKPLSLENLSEVLKKLD